MHITCKKITTRVFPTVGLIGLLSLLTGCPHLLKIDMMLAHNKDVTKNEKYLGEYQLGQQYELLMDVFLIQVDNWSERLVLTPEGQLPQCAGLYIAPNSVAEYYENPDSWQDVMDVIDVINAGTHIECMMVRKHGTPLWGSSTTTFAEIKDGPYKSTIVDITDISTLSSKKYRGNILRKPDTRILREVFSTEE